MATRISPANRGRGLEMAIEHANAWYRSRGLAVVQKVPTPTKVLQDRRGSTKVIREKSTVDFVGVVSGGMPVAFDAKSTHRPHLPMDMLHPHQVEFLRAWEDAGGISFLLVEICAGGAAPGVYLVPFPVLHRYWLRYTGGGRASISADELADCPQVHQGRGVALDWLAVVERLTEGGD